MIGGILKSWRRAKNRKIALKEMQGFFTWQAFHELQAGLWRWAPADILEGDWGIDHLLIDDIVLSKIHILLLCVPPERQKVLAEMQSFYQSRVNEMFARKGIGQPQLHSGKKIWDFLRWRYPKTFTITDGLHVYRLLRVTVGGERTEEVIGEYRDFDTAAQKVEEIADGQRLFWGRASVGAVSWFDDDYEYGASKVADTQADLLTRWANREKPEKFRSDESVVSVFLESQAYRFFRAQKSYGVYDYFDIERIWITPFIDTLPNDRLEQLKGNSSLLTLLTEAEKDAVEDFFNGWGRPGPEECLIFVSKINEIKRLF